MPRLSLVVPVYNEAANVPALVQGVEAAFNKAGQGQAWEMIIVDDNSPDGTAEVARAIAATNRQLRVIKRIGRRGLSSAVMEGFLSSSAPYVAVMDGDGQHDEALLPTMLERLENGADAVVASRYVKGGSAAGLSNGLRQALSALGTKMTVIVLNVKTSDPMSGFFAIRRPLAEQAATALRGRGFKVLVDILARVPRSTQLVEVPLVFRNRLHGESKLGPRVFLEALVQLSLLLFKRLQQKKQ
ncbi:polyprenol monophosphomannose synthase [Formicincola oecophyllae]|uniref:Polyprenol monophosphomannose synthase n=2 Tax=Formicincola oecophyllae TaxID=2558361 RepID=A0A4Y6UEB5_9PROT|nr:polyprenol monophosphomannose synthase [Formicincola oecophyllae]